MNIRGVHKTSLIDYPGFISAVVFTGGCNFRCDYCYNGKLAVNDPGLPVISEEEVLSFLEKRRKLIDGVVITGGEPTLMQDLPDFIAKIKKFGYKIKLDTNGSRPSFLKKILNSNLIDYIALDIKTSPSKYNSLTKSDISFKKIAKTKQILDISGADYEIRTTVIPGFFTIEDISEIEKNLGRIKSYYLQQFVPEDNLNPEFMKLHPLPLKELTNFRDIISKFSDKCEIRGA